jgi:hypothetical protein
MRNWLYALLAIASLVSIVPRLFGVFIRFVLMAAAVLFLMHRWPNEMREFAHMIGQGMSEIIKP